jgi:hypothetical protein
MMFNATSNNISVILWQSVLLVEQTGVPEKTTHHDCKVCTSCGRFNEFFLLFAVAALKMNEILKELFLADNRQRTDGQTDRTKTICLPTKVGGDIMNSRN